MVVQDKIRSSLYTQLETSFGTEEAGLLMEAVPPLGWSSLVTHDHFDARVAQIDARFDSFEARVDARFDSFEARVDSRFEMVDARFEMVDARFDMVDARFEKVDARFEMVDARFDRVDGRLEMVDARLVTIEDTMVTKDQFTAGMAQFGERFQTDMLHLHRWLIGILITFSAMVIGLLFRAT